MARTFKRFIAVLIPLFCLLFSSCNVEEPENDSDNPNYGQSGNDNGESEGSNPAHKNISILGHWTIEDYNTGNYSTFEFKSDGKYYLLQPHQFYEQEERAAGIYEYDSQKGILHLKHYYHDWEMDEYGDNPDSGQNLTIKCFITESSMTLSGEDCSELGFSSMTKFSRGKYSGRMPDFKAILCSRKQWDFSKTSTYDGDVYNSFSSFEFSNDGYVYHTLTLSYTTKGGKAGQGTAYAQGTYTISGYYVLTCDFSVDVINELNSSYSIPEWDKLKDGGLCTMKYYLALDNNTVKISIYPMY